MKIDDFAPNLSFFFSNGMDPEYAVIGRVARRIWARAMRDRYGAGPRSQMLKYHIQTSGRSLHAQEIQFNDIRTTLQALYALFDNCNSLHTNAYDEAITTPTEEIGAPRGRDPADHQPGARARQEARTRRRARSSIEELTDLVEEAVYAEFDRISERGGVLGAMETMYQRGKIQEESLYYETLKHDGTLPIVGVNTFLASGEPRAEPRRRADPLDRGGEAGPGRRRARVPGAQRGRARRRRSSGCSRSRARGGNVFAELMETVKVASLGQISARSTRSAGSTGATCEPRGADRGDVRLRPGAIVDAVGASTPRPARRPHRLPRPEHHRASLRPRPRRVARRADRILHPPAGARRAIPKVGGTKDVRSTSSVNSRRPMSS